MSSLKLQTLKQTLSPFSMKRHDFMCNQSEQRFCSIERLSLCKYLIHSLVCVSCINMVVSSNSKYCSFQVWIRILWFYGKIRKTVIQHICAEKKYLRQRWKSSIEYAHISIWCMVAVARLISLGMNVLRTNT